MSVRNYLAHRNIVRRMEREGRAYRSYHVTSTDDGEWMHAAGSDFLFAYLENSWPADVKTQVVDAFKQALTMSSTIKTAVLNTSGQAVESGLYLVDQSTMTQAMNSVAGMGITSVDQNSESGSGTAVSITEEFFSAILGGLGGDVAPMLDYLTTEMGDVQAQTKKSTVTSKFGTVIGTISVMPVLNVPVTNFVYAYSDSRASSWFVKVNCGSVEHESYSYAYTAVNYNYVKPDVK
ncbi:hypothetical protein OKW50_008086 [Paraburkholderia youngii]|uniref:hypothetical protein n=1 Tax=Paraburkholderia youngii TaxID=2782701 RepID=UPI003D19BAB4